MEEKWRRGKKEMVMSDMFFSWKHSFCLSFLLSLFLFLVSLVSSFLLQPSLFIACLKKRRRILFTCMTYSSRVILKSGINNFHSFSSRLEMTWVTCHLNVSLFTFNHSNVGVKAIKREAVDLYVFPVFFSLWRILICMFHLFHLFRKQCFIFDPILKLWGHEDIDHAYHEPKSLFCFIPSLLVVRCLMTSEGITRCDSHEVDERKREKEREREKPKTSWSSHSLGSFSLLSTTLLISSPKCFSLCVSWKPALYATLLAFCLIDADRMKSGAEKVNIEMRKFDGEKGMKMRLRDSCLLSTFFFSSMVTIILNLRNEGCKETRCQETCSYHDDCNRYWHETWN